jgi:extradiol dioxygenase family protein
VKPIFHLSFPVRDLDEAIAFYIGELGGTLGRRETAWADIALFGAQVTLQLAPGEVTEPMSRLRHFGATLGWSEWQELTARLTDFVAPPTVSFAGSESEQAKAMLRDPSGNLIEIKAYRHPEAVLGGLAAA